MPSKISFVFFGSGPVAARSLELLAADFNIEAVVTKPKPAHHRGSFPVIDVAEKLSIPLHTVRKRSELSDLIATKPFKSSLGVLIDFGIIVGQNAIDYFPLGIVNSHFSILPEWRGADPITFAILSGQETTGVSLMLLVEAMDEGPLLAYGEYELSPTTTTPELSEGLINLSYGLLQASLPKYVTGELKEVSQDITGRSVSYSRKLTKEDGIIDWSKPAEAIEHEIRAYVEWPKSSTTLAGKELTITAAHVLSESGTPGKVEVQQKEIVVYCGQDALVIDRLKPAGKNEMTSEAFLAGHRNLF